MWEIILGVLVLYLLFKTAKQSDRISVLEQKFEWLKEKPKPAAPSAEQPVPASMATEPSTPIPPPTPIPPASPYDPAPTPKPVDPFSPKVVTAAQATPLAEPKPFFLVEWFREQTLIKVGAVIFFLGAVWFLSYAFEQNWISPLLRIALGLLVGLGLWAVGYWRRSVETTQFQVLSVLGSAVWFGTVLASQFAFASPLLPAVVALGLMVVSIAYTVGVALLTKTEWLAVVAAIAGIVAPWFVNQPDADPLGLLVYLFVLSAGLLAVVFMTRWRYVSLTLLLGVTMQHALIFSADAVTPNTLWFFIVLFTVLFFTAASVTLLRTLKLEAIDITTFGVLGVQFWFFADQIGLFPALAMFLAAMVTALVGYVARQRGADTNVVALFAAFSAAGIFIGTSYLFDGFTLTIAYALEALVATMLAVRVAQAPKSIVVAAATYILPLATGFADLVGPAWDNGVLHPAGLSVSVVVVSLGIAAWYLIQKAVLTDPLPWLKTLAGTMVSLWYSFTLATLFVASQALATSTFSTEILFTLSSLFVMVLLVTAVVALTPWSAWRTGVLWSGAVPFLSGLSLIVVSSPSTPAFITAASVLIVTSSFAVLYARSARTTRVTADAAAAYALLWCSLGFSVVWLWRLWDELLSGRLATVATYVSYALVIYLVSNVLLHYKVSFKYVVPVVATFVLPGVMALGSFKFDGWPGGVLDPDAVGLYALTTMLLLLATSLWQYESTTEDTTEHRQVATWLYGSSGVFAAATVWMITHTVAGSAALAVTLALLIYTSSGLACYLYGRAHEQSAWRRAGIILLVGVVARLGLVDIWDMDPLWRVVTFLGIGALFIAAALIEKPLQRPTTPAEEPGDNSVH